MRPLATGMTMAFLMATRSCTRAFQLTRTAIPGVQQWNSANIARRARTTTQLLSSLEEDRQGRRIRRRGPPASTAGWGNDDNNDDDDNDNVSSKFGDRGGRRSGNDDGANSSDYSSRRVSRNKPRNMPRETRNNSNDGDDDDDAWDATYTPQPRSSSRGRDNNANENDGDDNAWDASYTPKPRSSRGSGGYSSRQRDSPWSSNRDNFRRRDDRFSRGRSESSTTTPGSRPINLQALEGAGFVHLYGLSSVLNALQADRRDLTTVQERTMTDEDTPSTATITEPPKPQALFRPYLFIQERKASTRKGQKATDAQRVLALAEERNVPIAEVDKGILNTLSGNRPHQGFVLRCGKLYFESLSRIPLPGTSTETMESAPSLWLVLDEVVDPQNLGALLRSAFFLGQKKIGILVCSKNSAPPTPVVSAASAGALELMTIYSTSNLPRTLNHAKADGFRIIGASSSVPMRSSEWEGDDTDDGELDSRGDRDDNDVPQLYDLQDLPVGMEEDDRPVLLVLGSEGYGLRTLVAKACTEFVRIPSGADESSSSEAGVDSLNVSVTGGILLWRLLNGRI